MKKDSKEKKQKEIQCDTCAYYDYDDDYGAYCCTIDVDEDDAVSFGGYKPSCPYYSFYDEYKIVRKQN